MSIAQNLDELYRKIIDKFPEIDKNYRQIYLGKQYQNLTIVIEQICYQNNFRLSQNHHQKYDIVWAIEDDFSNHLNWRHELDEMIRLIGKQGFLVIKCGDGINCSILNIKNFLGRRFGIEVEVIEEFPLWSNKIVNKEKWKKEEYITTSVFKIVRKNLEIYQDKKWTFGVVTRGDKIKEVTKFCESIRKIDPTNIHQILICGPRNLSYEQYKVDYVENIEKYRDEYAAICTKKNDIIDSAINQNLLICHDRYYLMDNFFSGFEKYGYDFDFLTIDVVNEEDEKWFPHYIKLDYIKHDFKRNKDWYCFQDPEFSKNNELHPVFINGGLNIFKKNVVDKIKFNECFFWCQEEDIEISKEFMKYNLVPRANMFSSAVTTKKIDTKMGRNLENYNDIYEGGSKRKKVNLYKELRKKLFTKLYAAITNKRLLNFLERIIFKI